jgi:hypothetical protein
MMPVHGELILKLLREAGIALGSSLSINSPCTGFQTTGAQQDTQLECHESD